MKNRLKLSKNTKTTPRGRSRHDGRSTVYPMFANSFGLPAGVSCPGATKEFCDPFCYAVDTEGRTNVHNSMYSNLELLRGESEDGMYELLSDMMSDYRASVEKAGLAPEEDIFRIHWDGDFFSEEYARAWTRVIKEHTQTKFWVYTRSFREPVNVVPYLYGIKNLAFYLSVDEGNIDDALVIQKDYPRILMAFCAEDQYRAELLAAKANKTRTTVCPENIGKLALMSEGKGACVHCMLCPKSRPNILFVDNKSYDITHGQDSLPLGVPVSITPRSRRKPEFDSSLLVSE